MPAMRKGPNRAMVARMAMERVQGRGYPNPPKPPYAPEGRRALRDFTAERRSYNVPPTGAAGDTWADNKNLDKTLSNNRDWNWILTGSSENDMAARAGGMSDQYYGKSVEAGRRNMSRRGAKRF